MRAISKSAKFQLQVRPLRTEAYASGAMRTVEESIYLDFQQGDLRDDEVEFAISQFAFEGGFQNLDEVTMLNPLYRLSSFDTDEAAEARGWTADEKLDVEEKLRRHAELYSDIIIVPEKQYSPPWPRYDEFSGTPERLLQRLVEDGHDLEEVLEYERHHQNRQPVLDVLEQALVEINEGEVVEEVIG